jgi:hypothetical protein
MQTEREKNKGEYWNEDGGTFSISFDLKKVFYYLKEHAFIFRKFWNLFLFSFFLLSFVGVEEISNLTKDQRWNGTIRSQNVRETTLENPLAIPSENSALVTLDTYLNLGHFMGAVKECGRNIKTCGETIIDWDKVKK